MIGSCAAIVIAAKHHELTKIKDTRGTTHTVGALRCRFEFRTTDWDYTVRTAMFCNGDAILHPEVADHAIAVPLDEDNECAVPYEVLEDTLPYSIGVWGATSDGLRIVSRWLVFNAQPGCYTDGNAPSDPEPTIYEQILTIAQNAKDLASDVVHRADSGEFDGETPYIGENGNWWIADVDTGVRAHGRSAYEVAKDLGYNGTEEEWIESLNGKDGQDGEDGVGISDVKLNSDGELIITFTDGTTKNVGRVAIDPEDYIKADEALKKELQDEIDADVKALADGQVTINKNNIETLFEQIKEIPISDDIIEALNGKVDKVDGKDLSTNDYTDEDKAKLDSINPGAEVNVQADWYQEDPTKSDYIKNKPKPGKILTTSIVNGVFVLEQNDALYADYIEEALGGDY